MISGGATSNFDLTERESVARALAVLWNGWAWIVGAVLLVSGLSIAFVQHRGTVWRVRSVLHVERSEPVVMGPETNQFRADRRNYTAAQAALLRSIPILTAALERDDLANSPVFGDAPNPLVWLKKKLQVRAGDAEELITVSLESPHREAACRVVNAIVDAYRGFHAKRKRQTATGIVARLRTELDRREAELRNEQQALVEFLRQNPGAGMLQDAATLATTRLRQLYAALSAAEFETLEAQANLGTAKRIAAHPEMLRQLQLLIPGGQPPAKLGTIDSESAVLMRQLETRRLSMLGERTPEHPAIRELDAQISELKAKDSADHERFAKACLEALEQSYHNARCKQDNIAAKIAEIEHGMREMDPIQAKYGAIETRVERARKITDLLYQRIREIDIDENVKNPGETELTLSVYEVASGDNAVVASAKSVIVALGVFLGLALGTGLAWLRSTLDRRVRTSRDATSVTGLPVLGVIPRIRVPRGKIVAAWAASPGLVEAARSLRTAVYHGTPQGAPSLVHVVAPNERAGKRVVASLAMAMAQGGQRTLIIDADLRAPAQAGLFGVRQDGLIDFLTGVSELEDAVVTTAQALLHLVGSGEAPRNPADLLASARFDELLEQAGRQYDRILVDSPPVLAAADARILAAKCDATMLAVRPKKTTRQHLASARDSLLSVGARPLGIVFDGAPSGR